jgi:hypothetical protein
LSPHHHHHHHLVLYCLFFGRETFSLKCPADKSWVFVSSPQKEKKKKKTLVNQKEKEGKKSNSKNSSAAIPCFSISFFERRK